MINTNTVKTGILTQFSTIMANKPRVDEFVLAESNHLLQEVIKKIDDERFSSSQRIPVLIKRLASSLQVSSEAKTFVEDFFQKFNNSQMELLLDSYLLALKSENCSQSTIKNYRSDIRQFLHFTQESGLLRTLTKPKVAQFLRNQKAKGLAKASLKRKVVSLSQFGTWLEIAGIVRPHSLQWLRELNQQFDEVYLESLTQGSEATYNTRKISERPGINNQNDTQTNVPLATNNQQKPSFWRRFIRQAAKNPLVTQDISTAKMPKGTSPLKAQDRRFQLKQRLFQLQSRLSSRSRKHLLPYLNLLLSLILFLGMGYFGYQQIFNAVEQPLAFPSSLTRPNRTLSFQGRLTDTAQNPILTATDMKFRLYDSGPSTSGGTLLWDSGTCSVTPDQDGIFAVGLGDDCGSEISSDVFSENANVWLQVEVESETLSPRQSIKSVAYALNSETLQGYPASASAVENTVVVMDNSGEIVLGNANPVLRATGDSFTIEAETLTLQTATGSNGDITLSPDGSGQIDLLSDVTVDGYIDAPGATLSATYAGGTALTLKAGPTATADIFQWQNSSGTALGAIDSNGNVGIGNASPDSKLEVSGSGYTFRISTGAGGNNYQLGRDTGTGFLNFYGSQSGFTGYMFGGVDGTKMVIDGAGNVGIGSASPTYKLDVNGTSRFTGALQLDSTLLDNGASAGTSGQILSSTGTGVDWVDLPAGAENYWRIATGAISPVNDTLDFFIGANATASAKFAVLNVNSGTPVASISSGVSGTSAFLTADGSLSTTRRSNLTIGNSSTYNTTGNVLINPNGTGNVGIGTTNASAKLYVNGNIAIPTQTVSSDVNRISIGTYGTISETAGGLGYITGNALAASNTANNVVIKTANDAGQFLRMRYDTGISFHTNLTGTVGTTYADTANTRMLIDLNGNVGIGTTTPDFALQVDGVIAPETTNQDLGTSSLRWDLYSNAIDNDDTFTTAGGVASINASSNFATNINTGTSTGAVSIGGGSNTVAIDSSSWDISTTGVASGLTGLTSSGTITFSGLSDGIVRSSSGVLSGAGTVSLTSEVTGILPLANGGTNKNMTASNGAIAYSDADSLELSSVGTSGYLLTSTGAGAPTWTDPATLSGTNYWKLNAGTVSPFSDTLDLLVGANATASAKFAVLNVNSGTPTASISSGVSGNSMFMTSTGFLSTTRRTNLTIGNSSTYNTTGNVLINPNGTGNVGIASTAPAAKLDVTGTGRFSSTLTASNGLTLTTGALNLTATSGTISLSGMSASSLNFGANNVTFTAGNFTTTSTGINNTAIGATTPSTGAFTTLTSSGNSTIGTGSSSTNTFGAGASSVNTIGSSTTPGALTLHGATTLDNTFTVSGSNLTTLGGNLTVTGTAWTATPTISGLITATSGLTANGALTANNTFTLGDNGDLGSVNTSTWDISTAGVASGFTGVTSSGTITFSGLSDGLVRSASGVLSGAGTVSLTSEVTGVLPLANGGTNKNLSASNGAIVYSDADSFELSSVGTSGYLLTSGGAGAPTWTDPATLSGTNYWKLNAGTVSPFSDTLDLLVGSSASASAKFAVLNVNSGTPVASISSGVSGTSAFLTADGSLSTTNRSSLTIGNSSSYNTTGDVLINPNGTGNVGIGTTNPGAFKLNVGGTGRFSGLLTTTGISNSTTAISNSAGYTQSGTSANTFTGTSTFSNGTYSALFTGGNVGIGTTTPQADLYIHNDVNDYTLFVVDNPNTGTAAATSFAIGEDPINSPWRGIFFEYYNSGYTTNGLRVANSAAMMAGGGASDGLNIGVDNATGSLRFFTNGINGGSSNVRMLIEPGGNIGVNDVTPTYGLDVNATARFTSAVDFDGDIELNSTLTDVNGSVGTSGQVLSSTASGVDWVDASTVGTDNQTLAQVLLEGNSAGATNIDMNNQLILNIGNAGTDFTSGGGLTLAGALDSNGEVSIADTNIQFDGASTTFTSTGNFTLVTGGTATLGDNTNTVYINSSDWDISTTGAMSGISGITNDSTFNTSGGIVNINDSSNFSTNINTGTSTGTISLGGGSSPIAVNSSSWDVSTAGVGSGFTGFTSSGTITFSGLTANRLVTTTTGGQLTTTISSANAASSFSDETGSGLIVFNTSPEINTSITTGSSTFALLNTTATTINFAGAASTLNIGPGSTTATSVNLAGGSGATGCTVDGATGNLTCTGTISGSNSSVWQYTNGAISPITPYTNNADLLVGSNASASAKFAILNVLSGTPTASISSGLSGNSLFMTADGSLSTTRRSNLTIGNSSTYNTTGDVLINPNGTGNLGVGTNSPDYDLQVNGTIAPETANQDLGTSSLRWDLFSNAIDNSNTFTTAGGAVNINASSNFATNINTGTSTGALSLGGGAGTVAVNSTSWDISTAGVASGFTGLTSSGTITFSGLSDGLVRSASGVLSGAGTVSLTTEVTGILPLANGGTNKNLSASNGAIVYSDADSFELSSVGTSGYLLTSGGAGAPTWTDPATLSGTNYWKLNAGTVSPFSDTLDLLVGANATASAKFAVLNVNSGTPVASISSGVSGTAAFLTAGGKLGTANRMALQIGNSSGFDTTGNILLHSNGTGNVGIGTTNANAKLALVGSSDAIQFILKANSTQSNTNPLMQFQNSSGTELFRLHSDHVSNIFLGNSSGASNTVTGSLNQGEDNTFIGYLAGSANTTGGQNTALGSEALSSLTTGERNVSLGYLSLQSAETSSYNIAVGSSAMENDVSGLYNIAIGLNAFQYSDDSTNNIVIGANAGLGVAASTTVLNNVIIGTNAGTALLTGGDNNVLLGHNAGDNLTTGSANIVLGYNLDAPSATSTQTLTIGNLIFGTGLNGTGTSISTGNIGIGTTAPTQKLDVNGDIALSGVRSFSLRQSTNWFIGDVSTAITSASGNLGFGVDALDSLTSGIDNLAFGNNALDALTTGGDNIALGQSALSSVSTTSDNIAIGDNALSDQTDGNSIGIGAFAGQNLVGYYNVFIGDGAGIGGANLTGISGNVFLGREAGRLAVSDPDYNILLGYQAGYNVAGDNNVFIGYQAGYNETGSDKLYIDNSNSASPLIWGDFASNLVNINGNLGIGDSTPTYALDVNGTGRFTGAVDFDGDIELNSTLTDINGAVGTSGQVLSSTGTGVDWIDLPAGSENYWRLNLGAISPVNDTLDFLVGANASASAKFAVLNVNSGTPVASISSGVSGTSTFLTADGSLSTTRRSNLTIGNSSTYDTTGNVLINSNGTGYVGVGTTAVGGDYAFSVYGSTSSDFSRLIDLTQTNDVLEDTIGINYTSTVNKGSGSMSNVDRGLNVSMTSTATITGTDSYFTQYAMYSDTSLSNITLSSAASGNSAGAYGSYSRIIGSPVYNNPSGGASQITSSAVEGIVGLSPTLTTVGSGSNLISRAGYFSNSSSSAGNANFSATSYGVYGASSGNLTTTGTTSHYAGYFTAGGTADTNYGLYVTSSGATTNYGVYSNTGINYFGGNVGIGSTAPAQKLDVQGNIALNNNDLQSANYISISDPGAGEGYAWNSTSAGWIIDVSNLSRANGDGNLNLYGTANNIALWRPSLWVYDATNYTTATAQSTGGLDFTSTGTGHITFNPGGNVGVGTTSPGSFKLQVTGSVGPTTDDTYDLGSNSLRWQDLYVGPASLHVGTSTTDEGTISYDTTGNIFNFGTDSTTNGDIAFFTDDLYLDKSSGNVGIGTTNPSQAKLQVIGTIRANLGTTGQSIIGTGTGSNFQVTHDGSATVGIFNSASGANIDFRSTDGTTSRMFLDTSGGNVGIGTTTPDSLLQVSGKAHFNNVFVGGTPTGGTPNYASHTDSVVGNTNLWLSSRTGGNLYLNGLASSGNVYAVTNGGNVGIGTITTNALLTAQGSNDGDVSYTFANSYYNTASSDDTVSLNLQFWYGNNNALDNGARISAIKRSTYQFTGNNDADLALYTTADRVVNEVMRLTSEQNVGIGTTTASRRLHVYQSSNAPPVRFQDTDGYCEINPTSTTWSCTSDIRLKKDITTLSQSSNLDKLLDLNAVSFLWKTQTDNDKRFGFIAQEVEQVFPEFVNTDENGMKSVSYGAFTPIIISAMQEQQQQITALSANSSDNITFNTEGELIINGSNGVYTVADASGNILTTIVGASKVVAGKVRAGLITTKELVVTKSATIADLSVSTIKVSGQNLSDYVRNIVQQELQTNPLPAGSIATDFTTNTLNVTKNATVSGNLAATSVTTNTVTASTSALGSLLAQTATVSGDLTVKNDASVAGTLIAGKVTAQTSRFDTIEARMAQLEAIKAQTAVLVDATVSGTLYADNIANFDDKVASSFKKPSLLQMLTGDTPEEPTAASPASIFEPVELAGYISTNPDLIATDSAILALDETDVVLGASALFVDQYLDVNGHAFVAQNLSVGGMFKVNNSLFIGDGAINYQPEGDANPVLAIQSSGVGTLDLLAGALRIEAGQVAVTGDLTVAGRVQADTLLTNLVQPADFGTPFQVQVAGVSTESGQVKKTKFEIINENGDAVASFDADGNASFQGGVSVGNQNLTGENAENDTVTTDKSSGKAKLSSGKSELKIQTPKATPDSLIYVTPKGSTENKVLFIKNQGDGEFTVGFDQPIGTDVEFNWWIVN